MDYKIDAVRRYLLNCGFPEDSETLHIIGRALRAGIDIKTVLNDAIYGKLKSEF